MSWQINNEFHNPASHALESEIYETNEKTYKWFLYGIQVTEDIFDEIISYAKSTEVPLWVSFLFALKIVTEDSISIFMNEENEWNPKMPVPWILRAWGVTGKVFNRNLLTLHEKNHEVKRYYPDREQVIIESFISIAVLEDVEPKQDQGNRHE